MLNFYPNLNKREAVSPVLSTSASNNRKKIRDYSYCSADRIGKGFSSVVYRGTNDLTSNHFSCMEPMHFYTPPLLYLR